MNKRKIALALVLGITAVSAPVTAAIPNAAASDQQMMDRSMAQARNKQEGADLNFFRNAAVTASRNHTGPVRNVPPSVSQSAVIPVGAAAYYDMAQAERDRSQAREHVQNDQTGLQNMKFLSGNNNTSPVSAPAETPEEAQAREQDMQNRINALRQQHYEAELQQMHQQAEQERENQKAAKK